MLWVNWINHGVFIAMNDQSRTADPVKVAELSAQLRLDLLEAAVELSPQFGEALLAVHGLHRRPHPLRPLWEEELNPAEFTKIGLHFKANVGTWQLE